MKLYVIALIMLSGILLSCNKDSSNNQTATVQDIAMEPGSLEDEKKAEEVGGSTTKAERRSAPPGVLQTGNPTPGWDKKIIKIANVTLELKDYKSYSTSIRNNLKRFGAYIAGEEQVESDNRISNTMTIKVPVEQFEDLMNSFDGEGITVVARRITSEDVTSEVVDTKARIDAKKQVRSRYIELLKQAKNMEEILQVQNEINAIQEDLETAEGRFKYLSQQSAYSTIHLNLYQYHNGASGFSGEPGFFSKLKEAFGNGGYIIKSAVLFVVTIWPLILAAFAFWFIMKKWKQSTAQNIRKA